MNNIDIKFLADCKQHIPYLAKLWYEQISKQWVPDSSIERATKNLIAHANYDLLPITFVAFVNESPVGMASLRDEDGIQPEHTPWLGSLIVDPAYRNQKIGEKLINAIKQQAIMLGHQKLYLLAFDPTIPNWYAKLGWKSMGTDVLFSHPVAVMNIELNT